MDTPHNDKQRKSLFPYKLAQTLVGLIAVCFLIFCIRSPSTSSPSPFQTTSSEKETALKWIFITPYGETDSSYADLFLSQEDCTELAGTPVELSFCTIEKYLNMTASGISADVVTCWYTDANFKRLETTGTTWTLQDLLNKEIPGFTLPENFIRWCGNFQGDVYAYPHTRTILSEDTSIKSAAAMIGRKDILEKIHWDSQQPLSKAYCLEQLKAVRKAYPELIPCYVELPSLQQMFGVTADTGTAWEDPFFHPGTLESLEFMNTLFRERLLSRDVFTLSQESLLRQLQNGEIFLAASPSLGKLLSLLPESHPIWEQYEILSPILSDSGREPALSNNFEEQYVSTLFVKSSTQSQFQARLLAAFYLQNMEPSPVILTILVLIFNLGLQLLIICASTIYAVKKLDLTIKRVVISLPILYLLFGLFSPPSIYLFVFTDKWSFFSVQHPAMPSWKASIFITVQYGIVMLITTLIA